jgi:hypothetical protein
MSNEGETRRVAQIAPRGAREISFDSLPPFCCELGWKHSSEDDRLKVMAGKLEIRIFIYLYGSKKVLDS